MDLVDRLEGFYASAKKLALAGILAGGVAYNSGCTPVAIVGGAALIAQSNRDAAEREAQARENAARINAQNNPGPNRYCPQVNTNSINKKVPFHTFYACTYDTNSKVNGPIKDNFKEAENIAFHSNIINRKGDIIKFILRNEKLNTIKEEIKLIDSDSWENTFYSPVRLMPGHYTAMIEQGNGFLGIQSIKVTNENKD